MALIILSLVRMGSLHRCAWVRLHAHGMHGWVDGQVLTKKQPFTGATPWLLLDNIKKTKELLFPPGRHRLPGGHRARRTARSAARQQRSIVPVPAARAANAPLRICRCTRPPTHTCTRTHARMEGIGCARVVCAALKHTTTCHHIATICAAKPSTADSAMRCGSHCALCLPAIAHRLHCSS
jgi:hypothetical protein